MTFAFALTLLRERWRTLVLGALVGLIAAAAASAAMPGRYAATASVYVAGIDDAPATDLYGSTLLVLARSASYRELMISGRVLNSVTERLGEPVTADRVAAVSQGNSAIFSVTVTEGDPDRAAVVATAVAERFAQVVSELERPGGPDTRPTVAATVLDRAARGVTTGPSTAVNVLIGVVFGLLAAAAWVLLRGGLDCTVRSASVLRSATGGVALGVLPRFRGRRDGSAAPGGRAGYDEAVRRVRDHLLLAEAQDPSRALVFAGVMPGEGTTTLVRDLAGVLAVTSRVLVVDAHLRRPALAERYGVAEVPGIADVLTGRATLLKAIREIDGVHVLPAGTVPPDAGALLSSPLLAELLADLRGRYDWILVDGAPLVPALDAAVMARHADGVVLLCRDGVTTTSQLETAVEALRQTGTRVLGSVLTMSRQDTTGAGRYGEIGGRNVQNAPLVPVGPSAACGTPDAPEAPGSVEAPETAGRPA